MARRSTYVIFDGDNDGWAYRYIKGWGANRRLDFEFKNSHDLDTMTSAAQSEEYVKRNLRKRMEGSSEALLLVGQKTKNLYRYVRWELELALELGIPIIVVNLNKHRDVDNDRLPPILRDKTTLHIAYRMRAIKWALSNWPALSQKETGMRIMSAATYKALGLDD